MEHDKDLDAYESTLKTRTSEISRAVSTSIGAAGSMDSLSMMIKCLGETNKDVLHVLLRSKKDIGGSQQLLVLLLDYFNCSHKTLEFLNTLHEWLHGASGVSWRLNRVKAALTEFKADKTNTGYGGQLLKRALDGFLEANDPLVADRLRAKLQGVLHEQGRLYEKLRAKKYEVDAKCQRRLRTCRKVTGVVLGSVYIGLLVCVAVTAVLTPQVVALPLAALAAVSAMNPVDNTRLVMSRIWDKYEERIGSRSELINALMGARTGITLDDLEAIRAVVLSMRDKIQSFSNAAAVVELRRDALVRAIIHDMENKIDVFGRAVRDLEVKKNKCYKDVMETRVQILEIARR